MSIRQLETPADPIFTVPKTCGTASLQAFAMADPAEGFEGGRFEKVWSANHSGVFRKSSREGTNPRGRTLLSKGRAGKGATGTEGDIC